MAGEYDYVVIDTPPSSTMIANNGLGAARYVVIPTQMEYFSVYGIRTVIRRITNGVQEDTNRERGNILGIVPMMTGGNNINKLTAELLKTTLPDVSVITEIPRTVKWAEACQQRKPISVFAEKDTAAREAAMKALYLTQELVNIINQQETTRGG